MSNTLKLKRLFVIICTLIGSLSIGFMALVEDPNELLFTLTFPMALYCLKGKGTKLARVLAVILVIFTSLSLGSVINLLQTLGIVDLYAGGAPTGLDLRFSIAALGCGILTGIFCDQMNR